MTKNNTSTLYEMMRKSDLDDEDAIELDELNLNSENNSTEEFTRKYKEFYSDIKISIKEDW